MTDKKKVQITKGQAVGLGVGISAAVAAAAGAYFLYGSKNAARNRKVVKSWMLKAKAEVLEKLEQAQDMTQAEYEQLIDTVSSTYKDVKNASKVDLSGFKKEMKDHWKQIAKTAAPKKKAVVKKVVAKVEKVAAKVEKKIVEPVAKAVAKAKK